MQDAVAIASLWVGAMMGTLKLFDWLLPVRHKEAIRDRAFRVWFWLSEQRAGRFTNLLRHRRAQFGFVMFAHGMMITITALFIIRIYWDVPVNATLELGHPRLYAWQVWVDIAALFLSALVVSRWIHPRVVRWIGASPRIRGFIGRSGLALLAGFCTMMMLVLLQMPIFYIGFTSPDQLSDAAMLARYERSLGGKAGVAALHALTAVLTAPIMAETLLVQAIFFLSIYWLIMVVVLMVVFRILQLVLARIVETKEGPIFGLSGLLMIIGLILTALK